MKTKNNTKNLFTNELTESNKLALKSYNYYKKVSDIIYRTNTALGKNKFTNTTNSATKDISIDSNAFKSTTQV